MLHVFVGLVMVLTVVYVLKAEWVDFLIALLVQRLGVVFTTLAFAELVLLPVAESSAINFQVRLLPKHTVAIQTATATFHV